MRRPLANIFWTPGTNCHLETADALQKVGAKTKIITVYQVMKGKAKLYECDFFFLPGGFSWGDHLRAGWISAIDFIYRFHDQFIELVRQGKPMLGICNGFQTLAATGLLNGQIGKPKLLLDMNSSARFEHWGTTKICIHHYPGCLWTNGLDGMKMQLPVAHAEGRMVSLEDNIKWDISATYETPEGTTRYPASPNGSPVAAISREIYMGIMPHPERRADKGKHGGDEGLLIFENGVRAVR